MFIGTTMGQFPRLTLVRLSPQVPDHMTVSMMGVLYSDRGATGAGDGMEKMGAAAIGGGRFSMGILVRGT